MGDKKPTKKDGKKRTTAKDEAKIRKIRERAVVESIRTSTGEKKILNPKRHRGKHFKGTRKGDR